MSCSVDVVSVLDDPHFRELKRFVLGATGLAYYDGRDEELASCFARQLQSTGAGNCSSYLGLLRDESNGQPAFDRIVSELTIGETYFFRHPDQFEALRRHVLPDVIERNREKRRLRIWSAGCATGPEPYSIAIVLRREFEPQLRGWEIQILGTDVNRSFLTRAREGTYTEWSFRSVPDTVRRSCFREKGAGWTILPEFKELVSFQYHNLVAHPFPSLLNNLCAFDVIVCRNVTIYFDADGTRQLVERFNRTLVDGGWLIMGHAELHHQCFDAFETVTAHETTLYRKATEYCITTGTCAQAAAVSPASETWTPVLPEASQPRHAPAPSPAPPLSSQGPRPEDVSDPQDHFDEVRELADRGELELALQIAEKHLERHPLDARLHFYKAVVLEQMGGDAESSLRASIYLDRDYVVAHYHLGLVLLKKGKRERAARCFENVRALVDKAGPSHIFVEADGMAGSDLVELADAHVKILRSPRAL